MKKYIFILLILLLASPVFAATVMTVPSDTGGNPSTVIEQTDCASPLIKVNQICRDTDDSKYYKLDHAGTGIEEIGAGAGAGMTYPDAGVGVSTGSAWGTSLSTDGSGDCGSGAVCLGDHTHAADTTVFTNKTFDASATGNVLKTTGEIQLTHPHQADQTKAIIQTDASTGYYGQAVFDDADGATNWTKYRIKVPSDIDTSVDLTATYKIRAGATETDKTQCYEISMASVADTGDYDAPTLGQAIPISFTTFSPVSGKVYTKSAVTLTDWKSNITANQLWVIMLRRVGNDDGTICGGTGDDSAENSYSSILTVYYGRTQ